jgi:hypothetical protein
MKRKSKITAAVVAGILLIVGLGIASALASDYQFPQMVRVNDDPINQNYHYMWSSGMKNIAIYQSKVFTVWTDYREGYPEIYLGISLDQGNSFTSNLKVNDDQSFASHSYPTLAVDQQGAAYIAWMDDRTGISGVFFTKIDNGYHSNVGVRVPANADDWAGFPSIAVSPAGDKVYLAWQEMTGGESYIKFARSQNSGTSFEAPSDLSPGFYPAVALGPTGEIYVAWMDWDYENSSWLIYAAKSADGGKSFSYPIKLHANVPLYTMQMYPSLAVHPDGSLVVSWSEWRGSASTIYLAKSVNAMTDFGPAAAVSDAPAGTEHGVSSVAVDASGDISAAWSDNRSGTSQVYLAKSSNGGQSFGAGTLASQVQSVGHQNNLPALTVDAQGNAYILWSSADLETYIPEVYFGYGYNMELLQNPPTSVILTQPGYYVTSSQLALTSQGQTGNSRNMTYSYQLDEGAWSSWTDSASVNLQPLAEGQRTFKVKAKDGIGQSSASPATVSFIVDYNKPSLVVEQLVIKYNQRGRLVKIQLKGSASDQISGLKGTSYRLSLENGQVVTQGSLVVSSTGHFLLKLSFNKVALPLTKISIEITATDKAGNQSKYTSPPFPAHK